jgi:hypothetical protein
MTKKNSGGPKKPASPKSPNGGFPYQAGQPGKNKFADKTRKQARTPKNVPTLGAGGGNW